MLGHNNQLLAELLALLRTEILKSGGDVAHGATDSGNPVKVGGRAEEAFITKLSDGQRTDLITDLFGRLRVAATDTDQKFSGVYYYQTGTHTVQVAADAANGNRWALFNPDVGKVRIRKVIFQTQLSTAFVATSAPRIRLGLFAYTPGTFGGVTISPAKRKSGDGAAIAQLKAASTFTGGTLTRGNDVHSFYPVAAATAVGYNSPGVCILECSFDDVIELGPNEGLICDQPDAGTSGDTRKYLTTIITEEY